MKEVHHKEKVITDKERLSKWIHAGSNLETITPAIARLLEYTETQMQYVPGATDKDIQDAKDDERARYFDMSDEYNRLAKYGADSDSLAALPNNKIRLQKLLDIAHSIIEDPSDASLLPDTNAAFTLLEHLIMGREGGVHALFTALRLKETTGIKDVQVIKHLYRSLRNRLQSYQYRSNLSVVQTEIARSSAYALNLFSFEFNMFINDFNQGNIPLESNYFAKHLLYTLAYNSSIEEFVMDEDYDWILPFEILPGRIALFTPATTSGEDDIRIAPSSYLPQFKQKLANNPELSGPIQYEDSPTDQFNFIATRRINIPIPLIEVQHDIDRNHESLKNLLSEVTDDSNAILDFIQMMKSTTRQIMEKDLNVSLTMFTLREQFQIITFLKEANGITVDHLIDFTHSYGYDGLRTFLATEGYGEGFGHMLVAHATDIGERGGGPALYEVFRQYGNIIDTIDEIDTYLQEEFSTKTNADNLRTLSHSIRKDAAKFLKETLQYSINIADEGYEVPPEYEKNLTEKIKEYNTQTALLLTAFKHLKSEGMIQTIEDAESVTTETLSGADLMKQENAPLLHKITTIYKENFSHCPAEFQKYLIHRFTEKLKNDTGNTKIYLMQYKTTEGETDPIAFFSVVEDPQNQTVEASALNINPIFQSTEGARLLLGKLFEIYDDWTINVDAPDRTSTIYQRFFHFKKEKDNQGNTKEIHAPGGVILTKLKRLPKDDRAKHD